MDSRGFGELYAPTIDRVQARLVVVADAAEDDESEVEVFDILPWVLEIPTEPKFQRYTFRCNQALLDLALENLREQR